ncbi:MAG: hypothetical protein HYY57_01175 [Candidatus Omnitrophica bacterium]|nr:hypothetical protein [Candidatus Omnitrophota bacterium]
MGWLGPDGIRNDVSDQGGAGNACGLGLWYGPRCCTGIGVDSGIASCSSRLHDLADRLNSRGQTLEITSLPFLGNIASNAILSYTNIRTADTNESLIPSSCASQN